MSTDAERLMDMWNDVEMALAVAAEQVDLACQTVAELMRPVVEAAVTLVNSGPFQRPLLAALLYQRATPVWARRALVRAPLFIVRRLNGRLLRDWRAGANEATIT